MNLEVVVTADGSRTVFDPRAEATFHSRHGALAESKHIFIDAGLNFVLQNSGKKSLSVLEIGYGSGLNAMLTLEYAMEHHVQIEYTGIDKYEFPIELYPQLEYRKHLTKTDEYLFQAITQAPPNKTISIHSSFVLHKIIDDFIHIPLTKIYDVVYFDAFSPRQAPDMWTKEIFSKLHTHLNKGGVLVTFCAQGQFKRDLKSAGFEVQRLPGAPGKREMTRGIKN